ncbi:MAG: sulfatase, partial [FCB group bacterium]|nr:sulfatase [FCB group bacterium]
MLTKYLKTGIIHGAVFGLCFLLIEDFAGLTMGADFTFMQVVNSLILYTAFFTLAGLAVSLWFYFFISKKRRTSFPLEGHLLLLLTGCAFFLLGFKPIYYKAMQEYVQRLSILFPSWAVIIYLLHLIISWILKIKGGRNKSVFNRRALALTAFLTVVIITSFKLLFNPKMLALFSDSIPWRHLLALLCGFGAYLVILSAGKLIYPDEGGAHSGGVRGRKFALGVIIILLSFLGWKLPLSLHQHPSFSQEQIRHPGSPPNIILLVIDAFRADYIGLYGYNRLVTSNLDSIAERGVVFNRAYAVSSWTKPSMSALNTSRHSEMNCVMGWDDLYPDDLVMLPEMMKEAGYFTGMISSNQFVTKDYNFAQGVDDFTYVIGKGYRQILFPGDMLATRFPALFELAYRMELVDFEKDVANSASMNEIALPWLERNRDAVFYLQLHYMDPHVPYLPKERHFSKGKHLDSGDFRVMRMMHDPRDTVKVEPEAVDKIVSRYDDEIIFADKHLGNLFRQMNELGLWENTLLIITSDHGEEFTDHGFGGHGHSLFEELIHIPLIMIFPGSEYAGMRIKNPVTLLDIMPTIHDYLDIGGDLSMEGESLLPIIEGNKSSRSVLDKFYYGCVYPIEENWIFRQIRAVSDFRYKYIRGYFDEDNYREYLFDLSTDPHEKNNIIADNPLMADS